MKENTLKKFICISAAIIAFACQASERKIATNKQFLERARSMIIKAAGKNLPVKIAVMPFTYRGGGYSVEGAILADNLFSSLSAAKGVVLVERENIDKILDEKLLNNGGFEDISVRTSGFSGVDFFVFGNIFDLGNRLRVSLRLVDARTGRVASNASLQVNRRVKDDNNPVWNDIREIKKNGKRFKVRVWSKHKASIGDELKINFFVEKNCHVNVFSLGTSGKLTLLFPNRIHKDNSVKEKKVYSIPSFRDGFKLKVSGPKGINRIMIFASTCDVVLTPKYTKNLVFRELTPADAAELRDLTVELKKPAKVEWGEAFCDVEIR